ncbi:MAG: ubiquinol-cytochrome C chaperone family protein [Alphaproteobacteria bacterium]
MIFNRIFGRKNPEAAPAQDLYGSIVRQARTPEFYTELGVSDSVDGRFDLIVLHAFLLLRRLKQDGSESATLAQAVFDAMFADMDRSLREMGVGDLRVGAKVKQMATAFYGRVAAYDSGLDGDAGELEGALMRNLYRKQLPNERQLAAVAGYVRDALAHLNGQSLGALRQGRVSFGEVPRGEGEGHD